MVGELDVESGRRHVIADTDVQARPETEPISEGRRLGVRAEIELFGVD